MKDDNKVSEKGRITCPLYKVVAILGPRAASSQPPVMEICGQSAQANLQIINGMSGDQLLVEK